MIEPPKTRKYRKAFKGRIHGDAQRGHLLAFGTYGIKILEPFRMTQKQMEATRVALNRSMKRMGKMWIRCFPDYPVTKKPLEVRMGSGKGGIDHWVELIKPGRIIFEIDGVSEDVAKEAIRLASSKLPVASKMVSMTYQLTYKRDFLKRNIEIANKPL
jgi:large subunit ribosomal protein L16